MKFATLIALTSVSAIRIQQQAAAEHDPSAADIIEMCDKDDNDKLSKPEVMGCIDKFVKDPKHNKEAKRMVNKHWKAVAGKDNEVSEKELEKAMEDHEELAQKKGKKHHKKGDHSDSDDDESDSDESSDSDKESDDDHDDKELAQRGPPSAEDMAEGLIKHCDGDD